MARSLGWSEAEVVGAGGQLRLLMLRTDEGDLLFPSFQVLDGKVVPGLAEVVRILQTGTQSRWTWAQWLNTELQDKDQPRNIQYLNDGRLDEVIREAEHDARAWGS